MNEVPRIAGSTSESLNFNGTPSKEKPINPVAD
jgi:hypothetical protein